MKNLEGSTTIQKAMLHKSTDDKDIAIYEVNEGESMTIQNQAYTVKELLEKFTTGTLKESQVMKAAYEGEFYTEGIEERDLPEFVDRLDTEEFVNSELQKKKAAKKAAIDAINERKKAETTKKLADEEVKLKKSEE